MSEMQHFPKLSYVNANFRAEISLDRFSKQFSEAQQWLGDRVLEDCKAVMPHLTGNLQQKSKTLNGGRQVIFEEVYARYLYGGKVMIDSQTGTGPRKIFTGREEYILRFRKGAKLIATDRPLTYSNPQATDHWFDAAKARNGEYWISGAKKIGGGR